MITSRTFVNVSLPSRVLLCTLAAVALPLAFSLPTTDIANAQTRRDATTSRGKQSPPSSQSNDELSLGATNIQSPQSSQSSDELSLGATNLVGEDIYQYQSSTKPAAEDTAKLNFRPTKRTARLELDTLLQIGDLRIALADLLSLKDFRAQEERVIGSSEVKDLDLYFYNKDSKDPYRYDKDSLDESTQSGQPKEWVYKKATKAFSRISYMELSDHPNHFRFVVRGKYDGKTAQQQLTQQIVDSIGAARPIQSGGGWLRRTEMDGKEVVLEFRVEREYKERPPHVIIEVREVPNWVAFGIG